VDAARAASEHVHVNVVQGSPRTGNTGRSRPPKTALPVLSRFVSGDYPMVKLQGFSLPVLRGLAASVVLLVAGPVGQARAADIVDTAVKAGSFTTLVAAVKAAGLVDTLKGPGPFTVFAPTDAAFKKLPAGTVEGLLKPANKAKLASILTYHVVPGKVKAADLAGKRLSVATVQGQKVKIDGRHGVKVNNAKVVKADIVTDNGVIHVIDTVLLPPAKSKH
jgi:uncharacterized surface protein with fasciclin (FAS1) repeats